MAAIAHRQYNGKLNVKQKYMNEKPLVDKECKT
jgi:hypothetical protein